MHLKLCGALITFTLLHGSITKSSPLPGDGDTLHQPAPPDVTTLSTDRFHNATLMDELSNSLLIDLMMPDEDIFGDKTEGSSDETSLSIIDPLVDLLSSISYKLSNERNEEVALMEERPRQHCAFFTGFKDV